MQDRQSRMLQRLILWEEALGKLNAIRQLWISTDDSKNYKEFTKTVEDLKEKVIGEGLLER